MTEENTGQALAALRRTETKPCAWCSDPMSGLSIRKTCSDRCRQAYSRDQRKKKKEAAEAKEAQKE
ncbi:MAG: hypothetical protein PSN44_06310 [Gammaproteobacteria bacterium]|nr:hypothetical protein [Gammaproteobacteria bacterium]